MRNSIAYQNTQWNVSDYLIRDASKKYNETQEPLVNFFDFNYLQVGEKFEKNGLWRFKLEWEIEGQLNNPAKAELVWTQNFSPDQNTAAFDPTNAANIIEILGFVEALCADTDPRLQISYIIYHNY